MAANPLLSAEWEDLLARRPVFRDSLAFYSTVLEVWSRWSPAGLPVLRLSPEECEDCWEHAVALITEAPPALDREALEPLLAPVIEELAAIGEEEAQALSRFAAAWDEGRVSPSDLLPGVGKQEGGALHGGVGISADLLGFLTYLSLRPPLEAYFGEVRPAMKPDLWRLGSCPFCSAPPAWSDIEEDGKRWLSCTLCAGRWTFGRLQCPFCDNRNAKTLTRLAAEEQEEGYLIEACDVCRGYIKGVDRRVRWNAASALIEDWGTPHLDVIARGKGYWRATPSLIQLAPPGSTPG